MSSTTLPRGWDWRSVASLAEVRGGKRLPKGRALTQERTPHPYVRVKDMRLGDVELAGIKYVPEDVAPLIRNYRIMRGDLFVSVAGTLGLVGRIPDSLSGANLTENADRITSITCDVDFLMYSLMSEPIQTDIESIRTVGAQPKLALGRIEQFKVAVPRSRSEQMRIAGALRDVDDLMSKCERLIVKKQAIKRGLMQQLLTGKTRLPGFAEPWQTLHVASKSTLKARIGWQGLTTSEYRTSGKFRLVGGTEFVDGKVDWGATPFVDRWRFEQDSGIKIRSGDVLLTKDGTIGKTAYVDHLPGPSTLNSGVFVLRPLRSAYDSRFIYYMLKSRAFSDFLSRLTAGSTISHLYQRDLVGLVLTTPTTLAEQGAIAQVLHDLDRELESARDRLVKARRIKQGMMQELLTGRTRLPVSEDAS